MILKIFEYAKHWSKSLKRQCKKPVWFVWGIFFPPQDIVHIDLRALYLAKQHQSKWLYIIPETYQKFCPSMTEFGGTTPLIEQVAHYIRHLQGHITNPSQTKNY